MTTTTCQQAPARLRQVSLMRERAGESHDHGATNTMSIAPVILELAMDLSLLTRFLAYINGTTAQMFLQSASWSHMMARGLLVYLTFVVLTLRIPLLLRCLTMIGVQVSVVAMRTGAKTLWTA